MWNLNFYVGQLFEIMDCLCVKEAINPEFGSHGTVDVHFGAKADDRKQCRSVRHFAEINNDYKAIF